MADETSGKRQESVPRNDRRLEQQLEESGDWLPDVLRWGALAAGAGLAVLGIRRRSAAGAGLAVVGGYMATQAVRGLRGETERGFRVRRVMTIARPQQEVYAMWRDFEGFPRFMTHLRAVEKLPDGTFRWTAKGPAGTSASWTAELVADENAHIAWQSLPGSMVDNAGVVRFRPAPGNRGTEVDVELEFRPPAGAAGALLARIFGEHPESQVREDLRHFKQLMEAGEVATTVGQPEGPRSLKGRALRALSNESGEPQLRRAGGGR